MAAVSTRDCRFLRFSAITTTSAVAFGERGRQGCTLPTKFTRWERHRTEYTARIVFLYGNTFLFGNTVFGCLNEILRGAHNANDREDAERNGEVAFSVSIISTAKAQRCFEASKYGLGNIAFVAATTAFAFADTFYDARAENNGRNHLNNGGGFVFFVAFLRCATAKVFAYAVALKYADIAFTAVKDHTLFKHGDALNLLRTSYANTSLKHKLYVKTNVNRVKSAVETNGLNIDTSPNNLSTLGANVAGVLQYFVAKIRKINACIFKAIAVAAGIQNAICVNAYGFACRRAPRHARKFIFCHSQISF